MAENWNCDGSGPHTAGAVRILPTSADPNGGNVILCQSDWAREMAWRGRRNRELRPAARFPIIPWTAGTPYTPGASRQKSRKVLREHKFTTKKGFYAAMERFESPDSQDKIVDWYGTDHGWIIRTTPQWGPGEPQRFYRRKASGGLMRTANRAARRAGAR